MRSTPNKELERLQKEIEEATEKFLNDGGKITQGEPGQTITNPDFTHKNRKQKRNGKKQNSANRMGKGFNDFGDFRKARHTA